MKKITLLLFWIAFVFGKDFEFQVEKFDEQLMMPKVSKEMSYSEFRTLSTKYGIEEMSYALVVPGYVHFQNNDFAVGWTLLGIRLASYGTAYYASTQTADVNLLNGAVIVGVASYLYDWIAGVSVHEERVKQLRYKYSIKVDGDKVGISYGF